MSKSKHTPGPWGCIDTSYHAYDYRLTKPDGSPLPLSIEGNDHSEQRANARLIAAAPDLLEALKQCEVMFRVFSTADLRKILPGTYKDILVVLAKAEGD